MNVSSAELAYRVLKVEMIWRITGKYNHDFTLNRDWHLISFISHQGMNLKNYSASVYFFLENLIIAMTI